MGAERRRAGFRLPWAGEGEEATDEKDEKLEADVEVDEMTPSRGSDVPDAEAAADVAPAKATEAQSPAEPMTPDSDSAEFLANLVGAMRGVAETSRDASLTELRTAIEARIESLGTQGSEQETDLRRQADVDLEAVGEWERTEISRVRTEAEEKRDARRGRLDEQLAERHAATERQIEATRSRMAEHERDLAAFFAQLGEITDPAAFVAAAKKMPHAPDLDNTTSAPTVRADDPRLAALQMPATEEATTSVDPKPAEPPVAAETAAAVKAPVQLEPEAQAPSEPEPASEAQPATAADENPHDAELAERLAQLDERLSGATQPVAAPATAATNGGEMSTAIVVKGLGSFGAITSFKQALERVEGVRGVTLSLGPTGEFVYRASHASDFDIVAAIASIEGPTATIENTDGTLVVTLSRTR